MSSIIIHIRASAVGGKICSFYVNMLPKYVIRKRSRGTVQKVGKSNNLTGMGERKGENEKVPIWRLVIGELCSAEVKDPGATQARTHTCTQLQCTANVQPVLREM